MSLLSNNNILANGFLTNMWIKQSLFKINVSFKIILYFNIPGHDPIYTLEVMVWFGMVRRDEDYYLSFKGKLPIPGCLFCVCLSTTPISIYNPNEGAFSWPEGAVPTRSLPSSSFPLFD